MILTEKEIFEAELFKINEINFDSKFLGRKVNLSIILPAHYQPSSQKYKLLLVNDGQDFPQLRLIQTLNHFYHSKIDLPLIIVGIHANEDRIFEYGVAYKPDFQKRGNKAGKYKNFIFAELMPYISGNYAISNKSADTFFCGFSLGGLSAFDISLAHPEIFSKVGVFSGSFWWRSRVLTSPSFNEKTDRIMHEVVKASKYNTGQKFWLQVGTKDETADRNKNGIIDSIDDTQDLINELVKIGYSLSNEIEFVEVKDGEHNFKTWSEQFPVFLEWLIRF